MVWNYVELKWNVNSKHKLVTDNLSMCFQLCTCIGKSFVELVRYLFTVPDVHSFLSQRICQDPLERFFGCQRQQDGVHDNPSVQEFVKNTQSLRVIKSVWKAPSWGNCRGGFRDIENENIHEPLPKRARKTANHLGLH